MGRGKRSLSRSLVLLIVLLPTPLYGQQLATLNISFTDPSGSVIPAARITLRNTATEAKRVAIPVQPGSQ
jgi:hypothetical protein